MKYLGENSTKYFDNHTLKTNYKIVLRKLLKHLNYFYIDELNWILCLWIERLILLVNSSQIDL